MKIYPVVKNNILHIELHGDFVGYSNNKQSDLIKRIERNRYNIFIDGAELKEWDSTLLVILFQIIKISKRKNIEVDITTLPTGIKRLLKLAFYVSRQDNKYLTDTDKDVAIIIGKYIYNSYKSFRKGLKFVLEVFQSCLRLLKGKAIFRKVDFLSALADCGYTAVPIMSLISFMVGLILAFVGAIQLQMFGAEIYVASLVAIGMIRIMGPVMAGILMAGRTGANYTATIGTMQVNEEIDALKTMGIPVIDFLILPRMLALILMMPILTMFADIFGIIGGASVGITILDITAHEYWRRTIEILSIKNYLIGIFHGFIYGWVVSLCGCYYGINCAKNADSVGKSTTRSVVSSIVWIIITTGIMTFVCQLIGI